MLVIPYSGIYPEPRRNEPQCSPPANPLPMNKMSSNTGDAGQDGYTVLSRASRMSGRRPAIDRSPYPEGPRFSEDQ